MNKVYIKRNVYVAILTIALFSIFSCEKEVEIGASIIDQDQIKVADVSKPITANTEVIDEVLVSGATQYLLGVYSKDGFGTLKGSIVSQLGLSTTGSKYNYGKLPIIDSVLITIPYQSTLQAKKQSDNKPKFKLDSIFGNKINSFKLNVYELKTFLNTLNPEDPSERMVYKSNKNFAKGQVPLYSGSIYANANDTVAYINRYDTDKKLFKQDTIKESKKGPFLSIPLNKEMITEKLVNTAGSSHFESQEAFRKFFRGLYIEADIKNSADAHIIGLTLSGAKMRIFYSNEVDEKAAQDLNGNGTKGEKGVRIARTYTFNLSGVKSNVYKRDKQGAFDNDKRLYVQGAAGANVITDVFANFDIEELRKSPRLVTQANLVFYVDKALSGSELPEQLFIYNADDSEKLIDLLYTKKINTIGGALEKTDDGEPYRYVFKMTRHIADLLKPDAKGNAPKLAIKALNYSDVANDSSKKVLNYNWNLKGVVLHGSNSEIESKRPVFEMYYSKLN